jgi:hypothetical protein
LKCVYLFCTVYNWKSLTFCTRTIVKQSISYRNKNYHTITKLLNTTGSSYRTAGWAAIASGTIGILAFASLIIAVLTRTTYEVTDQILLLFNLFHVAVILQFLLMIPLIFSLQKLSRNSAQVMSRATLVTGVITLSCTVLFLLLIFPKVMIDEYYMIPQAAFGVWLVVVNWQLAGILSRGIRWFGMVVGVGLLLVGIYIIGFSMFVDPAGLKIPAPDPNDLKDPGATPANIIVHYILDVGTFMGVLTLPFWAIILGIKLLRVKVE